MTYSYVIVIYNTYIQIYCYCLLGHGLPKDLWREFLYIKIFLATLYIIYYEMYVSFWWTCAYTIQ